MNNSLTYDEIIELLPAFTMGVLEPDEMLAVSEAVDQSSELQARLEALDEVNAALSAVHVSATPPPTAVRETLMARVQAERPQAVSKPRVAMAPVTTTIPWWQRLFGENSWRTATSLAMILFFLTAMLLFQNQQRLNETQNQVTALETENNQLQEQLDQDQAILASLTNATQTVNLLATDEAPAASGDFYRTAEEVILVARGLSAPPEAKAYYLWGVVLGPNDEKIFNNLGLVPLDEDGNVLMSFPLPPGAADYDVIDVSLEALSDPPPPVLEGDIVLRGLVDTADGG